jgi:two-component system sensor histidine kinase RstB
MTGLFIRFYIGVTIILCAGMCLVIFASHYRFDADFVSIKEKALGAPFSKAKQTLRSEPASSLEAAIAPLRREANYPIHLAAREQLPLEFQQALAAGEDVLLQVGNELSVYVPVSQGTAVVRFGPHQHANGYIETDMKIALGTMLLLVALAIACLLRPLARQLRLLEQAAVSFAGGELSARVDLQKADSAKTLACAFNNMAERTESLVRTQRELLQAVSHELRTPLARISFAIDLIRSAKNAEDRESRLKALEKSAQELNQLVEELLQYVRLESNGLPTGSEAVPLLPLVEELIDNQLLLGEKIRYELGPELQHEDIVVHANPSGLARVLGNVLGNANRFAQQRVLVQAVMSNAGTTIEVLDDGPGIPHSERERVFEPFVRLDESNHGSGLGLALVKRIVTNHGGTVAAEENSPHGCRLKMFWPTTESK